jgi:hypothetical protein
MIASGRQGLAIPATEQPQAAGPEKEKAPENREPSVKFKLPSQHFSAGRRHR